MSRDVRVRLILLFAVLILGEFAFQVHQGGFGRAVLLVGGAVAFGIACLVVSRRFV